MCFIADSTPSRARRSRTSGAIRRKSPAAISRYATGSVAMARGSASACAVIHCRSNAPIVTLTGWRVTGCVVSTTAGVRASWSMTWRISVRRFGSTGLLFKTLQHLIDLRRQLPRVVGPLGTYQHDALNRRRMSPQGGEREVRTIAPAPERDAIVAERTPHVLDIVRALAGVVGLQVDAARGELGGNGFRHPFHRRQPFGGGPRLLERHAVERRGRQVRRRLAGAALIDADVVARDEIGQGRAALARHAEHEVDAGIAWPAGEHHVGRPARVRAAPDADDGKVNRARSGMRSGALLGHSHHPARDHESRPVVSGQRPILEVANLRASGRRDERQPSDDERRNRQGPLPVHRGLPSSSRARVSRRLTRRANARSARTSTTTATPRSRTPTAVALYASGRPVL